MENNQHQNILIYTSNDGKAKVVLFERDGNVWMNQKQIAEIFATSIPNISMHVKSILEDSELDSNTVVKDYLTTASDSKEYQVTFYSLEMILTIGYRVRSKRGIQFRQWATNNLSEYMRKGFIMDDERLKTPDGRPDYFDELLERIRDIRTSEKRFYQKVRDLFSLSSDYDATDKATQMFFAIAQNKLLYAITKQTASELIIKRADTNKPHMGLTNWKGKVVRKQDILIAKNYLLTDELDSLNRLVVIFLEQAELRVKARQDLTMLYWHDNLDKLIAFNDFPVLDHAGKIATKVMEEKVKAYYVSYDSLRKKADAIEADTKDLEELKTLAEKIAKKK